MLVLENLEKRRKCDYARHYSMYNTSIWGYIEQLRTVHLQIQTVHTHASTAHGRTALKWSLFFFFFADTCTSAKSATPTLSFLHVYTNQCTHSMATCLLKDAMSWVRCLDKGWFNKIANTAQEEKETVNIIATGLEDE